MQHVHVPAPHELLELGVRPRALVLFWFLSTTGAISNSALPPREVLAKRFRCSRSSIQRALRELRDQQLLPRPREEG